MTATKSKWSEPLTPEALEKLWPELIAEFPEDVIERTFSDLQGLQRFLREHPKIKENPEWRTRFTHKGYSTAGVKYPYLVERLNKVLGPHHWRDIYTEWKTTEGKPLEKVPWHSSCICTIAFGNWVEGQWITIASHPMPGGHTSFKNPYDAMKGAATNSLKKCLGEYGVGMSAYKGTLDDDATPGEEEEPPAVEPSPKAKARAGAVLTPVPLVIGGSVPKPPTEKDYAPMCKDLKASLNILQVEADVLSRRIEQESGITLQKDWTPKEWKQLYNLTLQVMPILRTQKAGLDTLRELCKTADLSKDREN